MSRRTQLAVPCVLGLLVAACGGGGDGGGPVDTGVFSPTSNTSLAGTVSYKSVNIPSGVTVTGSADLNLTVTGNFVLAGTLVAPCHALKVTADGTVTVSGTLSNACPTPAQGGSQLAVIGKGGYDFEGAQVLGSGQIVIVDGPNLNPPVSVSPPAIRAAQQANVGGPYRCKIVSTLIDPGPPAPNGPHDGVTTGADGNEVIEGCGQLFTGSTGGNLLLKGVTINGSSGLDGSNGTGTTLAVGGNGGNAGPIALISDEDIDLEGVNNFNGGNGGDGGDATATNPAQSGAAYAVAGHGGGLNPPGGLPTVLLVSNQGSINIGGLLKVTLGRGGAGGDAIASGGPGPASGKGGNATASAGNGGDGQPAVTNAHGAVNVIEQGAIQVSGGAGGNGGDATTHPGNGGGGTFPGSAGGPGGDGEYHGGKGGKGVNEVARAAADGSSVVFVQAAPGGRGGTIHDSGGNGGDGGPCPTPPTATGKGPKGGDGGATTGAAGAGGVGATNGAAGTGDISGAANGGKGGGGIPGGDGGLAGADGSLPPQATIGHRENTSGNPYTVNNSYQPGGLGDGCPNLSAAASPQTQTVVQGGTGSVQGTLIRTNVSSALDWMVKNPSGTTIASGTVPAGATTFSAQFPIAAATAPGSATYTLAVSLAGGPSASATFTVNVIAAGAAVQIVWTNCNTDTPMVYASWYDGASGAAPWNQLPINSSVAGQQSVSFTATQPSVQFVIVTRKPDGSAVTTTFYNLLATQLKPEGDASCGGSRVGTNQVQGAINLGAAQATFIGGAGGSTSFVGPATTWSISNLQSGSHTFIGARQPSNSLFDFAQVFRNVMVPGPGPTFDFTTNAIQLMSGTVTASNTTNSWRSQTNMVTPDGASGIVSRTAFNTTATKNQFWMPASALQSGEYNQTVDFTQGSADLEEIIGYWFGDVPAIRSIPFPSPTDFTLTQVSASGVKPVIFSATGAVPSNLAQLIALSLSQTAGGVARTVNFYESDAFNNNQTSFNLTIAPYATTWVPPEYGLQTGALVNAALAHYGSSATNGVFNPATSNQSITVAEKLKNTTPN